MNIAFEYYYKESWLNGRLVVERGYIDYDLFKRAMEERKNGTLKEEL